MSRKKLTLSVEERLTRRAKAIAEKRGTSVSRLVETFFTALEGEPTTDVEQTDRAADEDAPLSEGSPDPSPPEYTPSEWARRWRGAFAEDDRTYPDDPAWDEDVLRSEIETKHSS